ncbi:MAG: response regulator transcription factor [Candidatus Marinimicrobia bacterium]|nr:response regulator transcription factor [Candidatus Neomarinimicrobiota bacterium]
MNKPKNILVVEDDADIRELLTYTLEREGLTVTAVASAADALERLRKPGIRLVVLDLMLPDLDGLELCRRLRAEERTAELPVIMVTAKADETDVVVGLELGADDYLCKPFKPRELVARVKALLRRTAERPVVALADETLERGPLLIHLGRREVRLNNKRLDLTFTEFEVLRLLALRPGWVFNRYQIVDAIRGKDYPVTDRSVDVQLVGLRRKLGKAGELIETVRGVGYRFKDLSA